MQIYYPITSIYFIYPEHHGTLLDGAIKYSAWTQIRLFLTNECFNY